MRRLQRSVPFVQLPCYGDVTAVAWLINHDDNTSFMWSDIRERYIPGYDGKYHKCENTAPMCYVNVIHRDSLMKDLIKKLLQF